MSARPIFSAQLPPHIPAFVHLALLVSEHVGLTLKKLCTFFAVVLPQTRQIFYGLCILELSQVFLVVQISMDLVEIACVSPRLLLGILSSYGRHCGCRLNVQTVSAAVGCCRAGYRIRLWTRKGTCVEFTDLQTLKKFRGMRSRPWQKQGCAEANYAPGLETVKGDVRADFCESIQLQLRYTSNCA